MGLTRRMYANLYWWYSEVKKSASPDFYAFVALWFWLSLNVSSVIIGVIGIGFPRYEHWINPEFALVSLIVIALWVYWARGKTPVVDENDAALLEVKSLERKRALRAYWLLSIAFATGVAGWFVSW